MLQTDETGMYVVITPDGTRIKIPEYSSIELDDILGAKVRLWQEKGSLVGEAQVPAEKAKIRWRAHADAKPKSVKSQDDLCLYNFIAHTRVDLNGRL